MTATVEAGRSLRVLRELTGLTVAEAAAKAQVPARLLEQVEAGRGTASPKWHGLVASILAAELAAPAA